MSKNNSDTILGRLLIAYKAKNLRQLSDSLKIANSTMDGWVKERNDFPQEFLTRFAEETGYSVHWLLFGKGQDVVSKESDENLVFAFVLRKGRLPEMISVKLSPAQLAQIINATKKQDNADGRDNDKP